MLSAILSPDSRKVAYLVKNNIYILDIQSGVSTRITSDGKLNEIINGSPDWLYEEEFSLTYGFQWSPLSHKILYYRFD